MVRKPDALISVLPTLRETSKYQGQDKFPLIVWMVAQASHGDLAVGLYSWSHLVLPIVGGKAGSNPQIRDLILQLVERILSVPKALTILINVAVRKGERLMHYQHLTCYGESLSLQLQLELRQQKDLKLYIVHSKK